MKHLDRQGSMSRFLNNELQREKVAQAALKTENDVNLKEKTMVQSVRIFMF